MSDRTNNLPPGWVNTPLGEIVYLNPRWMDHEPIDCDLVSFIPMAAVEAGSGRLDPSTQRPWKEVNRGYTRFQEGDVLFAKITPCMENGKSALATGLLCGRGVGSTEFHVLRPIGEVEPKFVLYFLLQDGIRLDARLRMKGAAGQLRVPPEFLEELDFPLPPGQEQRRIVAEIEKQFTRLEAGVAGLKRIQVNLKRYRAAVLKAAVEGHLVPTEAELARRDGRSYEPASELLKRILAERRARWEADQRARLRTSRKEPAFPDESGLPSLSEGWGWTTLSQLSEIQGGIQKQPSRRPVQNAYPFLRVANVLRGKLDLSEVHEIELFKGELEKLRLEAGDLLTVEGNGSPSEIGRMAIWRGEIENCVHQNHIIRARLLGAIPPAYVAAYWNSLEGSSRVLQVASSTSGLYTLSVSKVGRLPVPLPPLAEQHRIVSEVERRLSLIDELEVQVEANLKRGERLRQAILKRAFEGKLVPQNPDDEPASVLLERICAEREAKRQVASGTKKGRQAKPAKAAAAAEG